MNLEFHESNNKKQVRSSWRGSLYGRLHSFITLAEDPNNMQRGKFLPLLIGRGLYAEKNHLGPNKQA
jgi:hypothetical protein